jgi:hypothetical protein
MTQLVERAWVPLRLHKPAEIVGMEPDTVMMIIVFYVMWTLVDSWAALPMVAIGPWLYATVKADKARGFMQHLLVRYGFYKLHQYPPTDVEVFCE